MNSQIEVSSLNSPSSEDLDDICLDQDLADIDISESSQKPHFLDYDSVPPPDFDEKSITGKFDSPNASATNCSGEAVKVDKKYEKDGEISDYQLAASGVTKRVVTTQTKTRNAHSGAHRKKHFLDENPIPPDYMIDREREHHSLDRNFERQGEFEIVSFVRKHSLDRSGQAKKGKESEHVWASLEDNDLVRQSRGTWPSERPSESFTAYTSMPPRNITMLGPKVECVYSLLSMLGSHDSVETSKKFLELSRSSETCVTLRRSGCIPLLVQMMHSECDEGVRNRAAMALHNVVHCHPDDKVGRREAKVLRLIEQIMEYCNFLKTLLISGGETVADDSDRHPLAAISSLMKVSFDEEHRHAMCQLGALQTVAGLVHLDHAVHGPKPEDQCCNSLRRYALMALTNLTFGDGNNKALLCANKEFMEALVAQLDSAPDDLLQVTASVLRNLSWRADNNMKAILNEIGTVTALVKAAMKNKNENTLKAILSALWNLSAHCSTNKAEFCAVDGALAFIVDMLTYEGPSKTLKIIENAGGILRNVSSHIAVREDYRKILRQRNCLGILLQQLKSESLTVVSNACGTLWNLSARFPEDQKFLWDNGAVPMLRSLIHSKHKMISEGSSAALKNLLNFRPGSVNQSNIDTIAKSMGLKELPTLTARKQRALEQELNRNLAETCENLDATISSREKDNFKGNEDGTKSGTCLTKSTLVSKNESSESVTSVKSDSVFEKVDLTRPLPPSSDLNKSLNVFRFPSDFAVPTPGFDVEVETELPIDYSAKYNSEMLPAQKLTETKSFRKQESRNYSVYQETDLDQPTDFSLRYAENQMEPELDEKGARSTGNEIMLILEDTVKCYQTEDTPYVISNAGSDSDLRNPKVEDPIVHRKRLPQKREISAAFSSESHTPEKPVNYCEEGTPGYFSRYESLSSLDEVPQHAANLSKIKPEIVEEETPCLEKVPEDEISNTVQSENSAEKVIKSPVMSTLTRQITLGAGCASSKVTSLVNSAHETPLMFSRRSSMDSLASAEPVTADDKSSVVSDFSRLASGVISPSELPDSPTQSMPQSPRRNGNVTVAFSNVSTQNVLVKALPSNRLRSVFEDEVNKFEVEHTPAQFSCATSLSNLSIDDEPKIATDSLCKEMALLEIDHHDQEKISTSNMHFEDNQKRSEKCTFSDGEEAADDDILLATCINIGMNRGVTASQTGSLQSHVSEVAQRFSQQKDVNPEEDAVKQYFTEDTPALLSTTGSNTNLSALSISTNKGDIVNISDESSNASDGGTELLEQCIREGMQKNCSSKTKTSLKMERRNVTQSLKTQINDPIAMLRRGGISPYLPVGDEMNKFIVEDSPCNFSIASGLSDLTVASGVAGPTNMNRLTEKDLTLNTKFSESEAINERKTTTEDSLSSISVESEDDTNLLSQAIAAGCNKSKSTRSKIASVSFPTPKILDNFSNTSYRHDANDSISSVDSSDSNDNQAKSLLEQCIRTGMNKQKNEDVFAQQLIVKPPKPTLTDQVTFPQNAFQSSTKTPLKLDRERLRERERKDKKLLRECISSGIAKAVRTETQIKPPTRHMRQVLEPAEFNQRFIAGATDPVPNVVSKNGETTSVAVLEQQRPLDVTTSQSAPNIAPDVEMRESQEGTNNELRDHQTRLDHQTENLQNTIGCDVFIISNNSKNFLMNDGMLDQSNEFPAMRISATDYNEDSYDMTSSNELLYRKDSIEEGFLFSQEVVHEKHKNPDLMLKSVERLTQELVSTAEYLRTNATYDTYSNPQKSDSTNTIYEAQSTSNSNSHNTWNEDTCPNDISFPSVSVEAPKVGSLNDDEVTLSDVHEKDFDGASQSRNQPNSLQIESDTSANQNSSCIHENQSLKNDCIQFKLGGIVQQRFTPNILPHASLEQKSYDVSSTITSSTIIAVETNKLTQDFMTNMTESTTSLEIDNIRPPSCMETISFSGYLDFSQSPQLLKQHKKSLPAGLLAKRAITGSQFHAGLSGSVESVNSSCNLENIKPPSLMDELLDSMISVDSITSEIVDNSLGIQTSYGTAFSDVDENTTTLQSCLDTLHTDSDSNGTPMPSDFSSAESTPKRGRSNGGFINGVKRALTPKQKRQLIKDRYKTYTIAADYVLKGNYSNCGDDDNMSEYNEGEEYIKVEVEHHNSNSKFCSEENLDDSARFQTIIITRDNTQLTGFDRSIQTPGKRRHLDPERFKTRTISYVTDPAEHADFQLETGHEIEEQSLTSNEGDSEDLTSIRALTKQFKVITSTVLEAAHQSTTSGLLDKTNFFEDETRATTESDYNSIECDQYSDGESCNPNTYTVKDKEHVNNYPKPRIKIPGDKDSGTDVNGSEDGMTTPETVPVVRGRKKPAYVSPYKRTLVSSGTSHNTSAKVQIGNVIGINPAGKNSIQDTKKNIHAKGTQRNNTVVGKIHSFIGKTNVKNKTILNRNNVSRPGFSVSHRGMGKNNTCEKPTKTSSCAQSSKGDMKKENPEDPIFKRQGTFVKEEATIPDARVVTSLPPSPTKGSKIPTKANMVSQLPCISKSPVKYLPCSKTQGQFAKSSLNETNKSQTKSNSFSSRPPIYTPETKLRKKVTSIRKITTIPTVPQRSNSNTSLRATSAACSRTNVPVMSLSSKSHSNLSRENVGSKICSIWKRSDEPKRGGKPPISNSKLIRSSTFDNSPTDKAKTTQPKKINYHTSLIRRNKNVPAIEASSTKRLGKQQPINAGNDCQAVTT